MIIKELVSSNPNPFISCLIQSPTGINSFKQSELRRIYIYQCFIMYPVTETEVLHPDPPCNDDNARSTTIPSKP